MSAVIIAVGQCFGIENVSCKVSSCNSCLCVCVSVYLCAWVHACVYSFLYYQFKFSHITIIAIHKLCDIIVIVVEQCHICVQPLPDISFPSSVVYIAALMPYSRSKVSNIYFSLLPTFSISPLSPPYMSHVTGRRSRHCVGCAC